MRRSDRQAASESQAGSFLFHSLAFTTLTCVDGVRGPLLRDIRASEGSGTIRMMYGSEQISYKTFICSLRQTQPTSLQVPNQVTLCSSPFILTVSHSFVSLPIMLALDVFFLVLVFSANLSNGMGLHGHQRRTHKNVKRSLKCPNRPHPPGAVPPALVNTSSTQTTNSTSPSSTSSSSSAEPTSSIPTEYSLVKALFPISTNGGATWSTAPDAPNPLPLSDATLNPEKVLEGLTHSYVSAPDGTQAMQAHYPAGSYNFQHDPLGGFSFYAYVFFLRLWV